MYVLQRHQLSRPNLRRCSLHPRRRQEVDPPDLSPHHTPRQPRPSTPTLSLHPFSTSTSSNSNPGNPHHLLSPAKQPNQPNQPMDKRKRKRKRRTNIVILSPHPRRAGRRAWDRRQVLARREDGRVRVEGRRRGRLVEGQEVFDLGQARLRGRRSVGGGHLLLLWVGCF